ncbi:MAG: hypothetical protein WBE86_08130 [Candidatus Acidiferrales bacterium]
MSRRLFAASLLFFFAGSLDLLASPNSATQTWKGYVTDTYCGLNRVNKAPTESCTVKCVQEQHAKYAFFSFADKKVYVLNPQTEAAKYAGQAVTVKGTVSGNEEFATDKGRSSGAIITASSITLATSK